MGNLGLIVMDNFKEFGEKVNKHIQEINNTTTDYIIKKDAVRFNNGEGKVLIKETVRQKDIFIISDIGNYNCAYNMFGFENHMSPDDHFQDIKRVISAISGNTETINLITPLLYAARQHKRKGRESLDCAIALQELERLGIKTLITFDVHDPNVQNAVPCLSFENFYPTRIMIEDFMQKEDIKLDNILVVSPDTGAVDRARYYADTLKTDVGMFYKRRDLSVVIDGKNPIVAHEYMGREVNGKDIIIVDDMIASGGSVLEVASELKRRGAKKIYVFVTFAFFTKGIEEFNEANQKGEITKIYATNLTYVSKEIRDTKWFEEVDCSYFVAQIISILHKKQSLSPILGNKHIVINNHKKEVKC
ncbi:MAG: ribose-phosphate diphosphokinase [Bacilli bacterium]|nr:ribose-phosphate diphosphokinase [Bacilli bacterium]